MYFLVGWTFLKRFTGICRSDELDDVGRAPLMRRKSDSCSLTVGALTDLFTGYRNAMVFIVAALFFVAVHIFALFSLAFLRIRGRARRFEFWDPRKIF